MKVSVSQSRNYFKLILLCGLLLGPCLTVGIVSNKNWQSLKADRISRTLDPRGLSATLAHAINMGHLEEAITIAKESLAKGNADHTLIAVLATALTERGTHENKQQEYGKEALKLVNDALVTYPKSAQLMRLKGYSYEILEELDKAVATYTEALELDPNSSEIYSARAHALDFLGNSEAAKADLRKALALNQRNSHAQLNLARILVREESFDEASKLLMQVIASPESVMLGAEAALQMANIMYLKQDFETSRLYVERAIQLSPSYPNAYTARAFARLKAISVERFSEQQRFDAIVGATQDLKEAIRLHEHDSRAWAFLGRLMIKFTDDKVQGRRLLEIAQEASKKDLTLTRPERENAYLQLTKELAQLDGGK